MLRLTCSCRLPIHDHPVQPYAHRWLRLHRYLLVLLVYASGYPLCKWSTGVVDDLLASTVKAYSISLQTRRKFSAPAGLTVNSMGPFLRSLFLSDDHVVKKTDSDAAGIDWTGIETLDEVTEALLLMKEANPIITTSQAQPRPIGSPKTLTTWVIPTSSAFLRIR